MQRYICKNYLNLDLLYNIDTYLFPLFYYSENHDNFEVYSPMTKRSVYKCDEIFAYYYDYKKSKGPHDPKKITIEELNFESFTFHRCEPFQLSREEIDFLENKIN